MGGGAGGGGGGGAALRIMALHSEKDLSVWSFSPFFLVVSFTVGIGVYRGMIQLPCCRFQ